MNFNNNSNDERPPYGTRHFYKNIFIDYLADVGDGPHNADNLLLGLLDAAHEWFEYHETVSNRFKGFITKAQEIIKD